MIRFVSLSVCKTLLRDQQRVLISQIPKYLFYTLSTPLHSNCLKLPYNFVSVTKRCYSTSANTQTATNTTPSQPNPPKLPTLKILLRSFYLLVHPDLFSEFPNAKSVNERSLKDFLRVVDEIKRRPYGGATLAVSKVVVTFYIKSNSDAPQPKQDIKIGNQILENISGLRIIQCELISNSPNLSLTKKRLQNLFSKVGMAQTEFSLDMIGEDFFNMFKGNDVHNFLSHNIDSSLKIKEKMEEHKTKIVQSALNLQQRYGVNVEIDGIKDLNDSELYPTSVTLSTLESFTKVVEKLTSTKGVGYLRNTAFNFNYEMETYFVGDGVIYLNRDEIPEEWERLLLSENIEEIRKKKLEKDKQEIAQARQGAMDETEREKISAEVSKLFGVHSFSIKPFDKTQVIDHENTTENAEENNEAEDENYDPSEDHKKFMTFLKSLSSAKRVIMEARPKLKKLKNLMIGVSPNLPPKRLYHLDFDGTIRVSPLCTPQQFLQILIDKGPEAVTMEIEERKAEELRYFVEVRLGLKILSVDLNFHTTVPDSVLKTRRAYSTLHSCVEKLSEIGLSGAKIVISDQFGLGRDGTIFIKWDATVDQLEIQLLSDPRKEMNNQTQDNVNVEKQPQEPSKIE